MDYSEKRRSRRAKIARPIRVRPSEPRDEHFEEIVASENASREGVYFITRRTSYYLGMRLFVTFPFTNSHDPMSTDYVAEVKRVDKLPNARFGIAVNLVTTVGFSKEAPARTMTRV
jgi:hypothetical protein